ncbi:MAG: NfeD family protein [Clostridia bacterium]|nr:NfeD family protein [Clostridia bacterium]
METFTVVMWVVLLIVFLIVEAMTAQLVTIWFAVGAGAALIVRLCKLPLWLQLVVFLVVSAVALLLTRPLLKKLTKQPVQPTNADRCIGQIAVVTEKIDNLAGKGQAVVQGSVWTARSADDSVIPKDACVRVERIDGVKLIVAQQKED